MVDDYFIAGGWGRTRQRNSNIEKRVTPQDVLTDAECFLNTVSNETHICTRGPGINSCINDTGGPLMLMFDRRRMVLEGIRSQGSMDCSDNVSTRVCYLLSWIEQNIN